MRSSFDHASRVRPVRPTPLAAAAVALLVAGCGGGGGGEEQAGAPGCRKVPEPAPRSVRLRPPSQQLLKPGEKLTAVVKTSCGTFEIRLDTKHSPKTTTS